MWTSEACGEGGWEHTRRTLLPTGLYVNPQEDLKTYIWEKIHSVLFLSKTYCRSIILFDHTQPQVLNYLPRRELLS